MSSRGPRLSFSDSPHRDQRASFSSIPITEGESSLFLVASNNRGSNRSFKRQDHDASQGSFASAASQRSKGGSSRRQLLSKGGSSHELIETISPKTSSKARSRRLNLAFSANKLDFGNLKRLYGRQEELEQLETLVKKDLLHKSDYTASTSNSDTASCDLEEKESSREGRNNNSDRCLVLVEGLSGTGKSALADQLEKIIQKKGGLFTKGKFDLRRSMRGEPLSAIKAAIVQLVGQILDHPQASSFTSNASSTASAAAATNTEANTETAAATTAEKPDDDGGLFDQIKAKLVEELADEMTLLARVMPDLLTLIGNEGTTTTAPTNTAEASALCSVDDGPEPSAVAAAASTTAKQLQLKDSSSHSHSDDDVAEGSKEAKDKFIFALRKFVQVIASFVPVVIVCDDLQWSDPASVRVLKAWLTDVETKNLMVVGCYREEALKNPDSGHNIHEIVTMISEIEACKEERNITVAKIHLDCLHKSHVAELLADLLNSDVKETQVLAQIVQRKTGGNPFAIQQYLSTLVREELLTYNVGLSKWIWVEDAIRTSAVMENVAALMKDRLNNVDAARRILPVAACLGSTFSLKALQIIVDNHQSCETLLEAQHDLSDSISSFRFVEGTASTDLLEDLNECEDEGFIEHCGGNDYAFVHDKVQEAALDLIQEDVVKFRLGEILWKSATDDDLDEHLFEIISLLSARIEAIPDDERVKLRVAKLYHAGGKKAMRIAAFRSACDYFRTAVDLISYGTWSQDREFCLDLYSSAAESEYSSGRSEQMRVYASRVLGLDCPPEQKMRVCYVMLEALCSIEETNSESITFGIDILSQMGCHIPTSKLGITAKTITGLLSTKWSASKLTPEYIDSLPVTTDPKHVALMRLLDAFVFPCYSGKPELIGLLCIEMHRNTMRNGITPYAAYSFIMLGFILSHYMGDLKNGAIFAKHSVALLEKYEFKQIEPKTRLVLHACLWHWSNPLQSNMQAFVDIYEKGMRVGECNTALTSIYCYLESCFYTGRNLESIDKDLVNYLNQAVDFRVEKVYQFCIILLQCVRNFRGRGSAFSVKLTGDVMNEAESTERFLRMKDKLLMSHLRKRQIFLACYFADYKAGAELAVKEGDDTLKAQIGQSSVPVVAFAGALCCLAEARKKRNRRYQNKAKKYGKMIEKWSKDNPNCVHYHIMLDAEKAALGGKVQDAAAYYEKAINWTGRSGLVHDQALASERLACLHLEQQSISEARHWFEQAIELYSEWKAVSKVRRLKRFVNEHLPVASVQ